MHHKSLKNKEKIFAVAPMMDWTDRHCRYFHRQMTQRALLYTEMVVADAVIHGDRERLIGFDRSEHPVALQLGGSDPDKLAEASRIAADFGYDEINLNVGCPSDRVQSGTFGACLMRQPDLVARCVGAMKGAVGGALPVTVKCRIGVDEQDPGPALDALADAVVAAGVDAIWVHARKAWLQGLSPKENRTVPPLDYGRVYLLKQRFPNLFIGINGGVETLNQAVSHLPSVDGVMIGRAAYQNPDMLFGVDEAIYGNAESRVEPRTVIDAMVDYSERHIRSGGRLAAVTRHMTGMFHGLPGARQWRRVLSEEAVKPDAGPEVILNAFAAVEPALKARAHAA